MRLESSPLILSVFLLVCLYYPAKNNVAEARIECGRYEFQCHTVDKCIATYKVCDGEIDCDDSSDEEHCDECKAPEYHLCDDKKTCIASSFLCDGVEHCPTGDDENGCEREHYHRKCTKSEFTCSDKTCIPLDMVCDGFSDCLDGTDESIGCDLAEKSCPGYFCHNRKCLESHTWVCDGEDDCGDGSDELLCAHDCLPENQKYFCKDNSTCISLSQVCNNNPDCPDKSDENGLCQDRYKKCSSTSCPAPSKCYQLPDVGSICICPQGYSFDSVRNICNDVDECENIGVCTQGCKNSEGSYRCTCAEKYTLQSDGKTCKVKGEVLLLYSNSKSIVGVNLHSRHIFKVADNLSQAIGVAFDGDYIYWTSIRTNRESISRSRKDGNSQEVILTSGLEAPEDLEVDWLTGNIYFTDSIMKHIGVCSNDGHYCSVLVTENVYNPRGIALDPLLGMMYWSDWGKKAMIAQAEMDGTKVRSLVDIDIYWPNCIAIDHAGGRLYWVDAKRTTIESVRLDGTDRRIVLADILKHPYGIAVFEDKMFWSDWETKSVHSANKFTGKHHEIIAKDKFIFDVHVYHSAAQPQINHACKNHSCSHLCLLAGNTSFSCKCPEDMMLGVDHRTCSQIFKKQRLFVGLGSYLLELDHPEFGKHKILQNYPLGIICHKLEFNTVSGKIFIADNIHRSIYEFDTKSNEAKSLIDKNLGNITGMSFDHLSQNLYWSDAERHTIEVYSLRNKHRAIVHFFSGNEKPTGLVVIPEKGKMFVSLSSTNKSHIDILNMDGLGEQHHAFETKLGSGSIQFLYDYKTQKLFWLDRQAKKIEYADLNEFSRELFRSKLKDPGSLALLGEDIIWSTKKSKTIYWTHISNLATIKSFELDVILENFGSSVFEEIPLLASKPVIVSDDHKCLHKNGGCSHICVSIGKFTSTCLCPPGLVYKDSSNKTCIESIDCEFRCQSGECLTSSRHCNGYKDCADGSDEVNCNDSKSLEGKQKVICRYDQFTCHDGMKCVENEARCDGEIDCNDRSDESDCENIDFKTKCRNNQHICDNGRCIDLTAVCDSFNDCGDNSDEKYCTKSHEEKTKLCSKDMFQCTMGTCIPKSWECDGHPDCVDLTDEHEKCAPKECPKGSTRCRLGQCIDTQMVCDGHNDCGDNSDEQNCDSKRSSKSCSDELDIYGDPKYFQCPSDPNKCIEISAKCNGTAECPRGEDEINCSGCNIFEFRCENNECIRKEFRCDKEKDCLDGSDELNCQYTNGTIHQRLDTTCLPGMFDCGDGTCIEDNKACDGFTDCKNGTDENYFCKSACKDNPCEQLCKATPHGAVCTCKEGYKLQSDKKTCVDVDECTENEPCAQICKNTIGGHYCDCFDGFMLRTDKSSCKSEESEHYLLFATYDQVRMFSENPISMKIVWSVNDSKIIGLDVNIRQKKAYFTVTDSNYLLEYNLEKGGIKILPSSGQKLKIAVDWITSNVYTIVKDGVDFIKVCNFNTQKCAQILKFRPRDSVKTISVDAVNRFIFYSVTYSSTLGAAKTKIYKARLDGSKIELLVSSVMYVTAMEVDTYKKELFYVDAHSKTLQSVRYSEREPKSKIIVKHENAIKNPSGLSIFENDAFIINSGSSETVKCHLYGDHVCHGFNLNVFNAEELVVVAPSRQKLLKNNVCQKTDCSVICIPNEIGAKCICSDGQLLQSGERCSDMSDELVGAPFGIAGDTNIESAGASATSICLVIAGFMLVSLFGYIYYKRRTGGPNFMINMHFQNPLLKNHDSGPSTSTETNVEKPDGGSLASRIQICRPIQKFLQGGKISEITLETKSSKDSMKYPLVSMEVEPNRDDCSDMEVSIDLGHQRQESQSAPLVR